MKEYKVENLTFNMDNSEYNINSIGVEDEALQEALNEFAEEGWTLHSFFTRVHSRDGIISTAVSAVFERESDGSST